MRSDEYPERVSDPEADGLPDTADDDSSAYDDVESGREADGPDPGSLPADRPLGLDRFGTTPAEAQAGTPLDQRLAAEVPEPDPLAEDDRDLRRTGDRAATGTSTDDEDVDFDADDERAEPDYRGPDDRTGDSDPLSDPGDEPLDPVLDDWSDTDDRTVEETPDDSYERYERDVFDDPLRTGSFDEDTDVDEVPDTVGRLVAPDEGAHPDREADEIALDAGAAGGGASAEEAAMHIEPSRD